MPYEYVMNAYTRVIELRQKELHENERPISMLASILVNQHKDPKKGKPVAMSDFFLYQPREAAHLPSGRFGAAAHELIKTGDFPSWALFCWKELSQGASGEPPLILAYIASDCMLLAPVAVPGGYAGLLIASESAGNQVREMVSPCGKTVTLKIPQVQTKVIAEEDVILLELS